MSGYQNRHHNPHILIIGGGPSGSAAAICCAKCGYSVTLMESDIFPRLKPGETLHPGIDVIFRQLGIYDDVQNANFLRHIGTLVKWNYSDPPKITLFGRENERPLLGYQASRAQLEDILLSRACALGITVLRPCTARGIIVESEKVIGVKTSSEGEVFADFVIDAGGGRHWLAKKLNLTIEKFSPTLCAYYNYAQGECHIRDQMPLFEVTPWGWIWTARVNENLYHWTRLNFNNAHISFNWLPNEFAGLSPSQEIHGVDVTWRRVICPAGPGYFMVGDAATVVDPASSHGVLKGLMSGIKASHTIFRIVNDMFPDTIAFLKYKKWVSQMFFHDITKLKQFYRRHPNRPTWISNGLPFPM